MSPPTTARKIQSPRVQPSPELPPESLSLELPQSLELLLDAVRRRASGAGR